eukprot:jgi/Bigna1/75706/fgenesh1_pg.36_\
MSTQPTPPKKGGILQGLEKAQKSKMMKYERGRQKVDEALGDEAASFLKLVNTVLEQQHGEKVDKAFNTLIRQFRIALYSSQPPPEKNLQKPNVGAPTPLLFFIEKMKELMDEISRPALLEKLLFDKSFEDIRAKMKALFEKIYQELLEGTGEIFEDTAERR